MRGTGLLEKRANRWLPRWLRPGALRRALDPYSLRVVCYHSVAERHPFLPCHLHVTPACLRRHVQAIRRVFQCITFAELDRVRRREVRFPLAITFDDGLLDGIEAALPILRECGVPATFFVSALPIEDPSQALWTHGLYHLHRSLGLHTLAHELAGGGRCCRVSSLQDLLRRLRTDGDPAAVQQTIRDLLSRPQAKGGLGRIYLDRAALRRLVEQGMSIGAHGFSHFDLARCTDIERESTGAKAVVERAAGGEVRAFAYPFGDPESFSDRTHARLRRDFDLLCTTIPGVNGPFEQDSGVLGRVCAYEMPEGKLLLKLLFGG
jgi:peptidoglycan/xylan/chitin deacetylase (PgdA/CDA1 family)